MRIELHMMIVYWGKNRLSNVKKNYVWDPPDIVCENTFILCFKQRIIDSLSKGGM
jgi:hypothetical protein